ncbi:MAG TPA: GNAT family N-acetyltransferase [Ktedonobacterales bacterium]
MAEAVKFSPASSFSLEELTSAFNLAFTGYYLPLLQTTESLHEMMRENEVSLSVSRVLSLNGSIQGIGLVAMRAKRGWVAGIGIGPRWRGEGYGRRLLACLLDSLRDAGALSAQLEALAVNIPALALYHRMGFVDRRELRVYQGTLQNSSRESVSLSPSGDGVRIRPMSVDAAMSATAPPRAAAPAWQREPRTLERMKRRPRAIGLWHGDQFRAYLLFAHSQGGLSIFASESFAVSPGQRAADVRALLTHLTHGDPDSMVRAVNVPPDDTLADALDQLGCPVIIRQRELWRAL